MRRTAFWIIALLLLLVPAIYLPSEPVVLGQSGVRALVINEFANIRTVPAIGADVIATVPAGYVFEFVTGRSADNEWLRVEFNGQEGWVNLTPLQVLQGDVNTLEVGDPRTIPYGGFGSPRAGQSNATSENQVRVTNGLRLRAGPSPAYPTIGNMFAGTIVPVFGRTRANTWIQVQHQGTLGWVSTGFVEFLNGLQLTSLPLDGIVAEAPPISERTAEDYVDTLRLFLARLDLAQPSLDNMRAKWTDAALNGRAFCRDYPARPSDYFVPVPLLAANFPTLNPIMLKFNDAMANIRLAIDLFIEVCNQPGLGNPVGQATVIGALEAVNLADRQFAELRAELIALIPEEREAGPNECLLTFRNQSEIIPLIQIGDVVRVRVSYDKRAFGFCFDALAQQNLAVQVLVIRGNAAPLVAVSPFDNPTNFLGVAQAVTTSSTVQETITVSETTLTGIIPPATGRYLLLMADTLEGDGAEAFLDGEVAMAIVNVPTTGLLPRLIYDPQNDVVSLGFPQNFLTDPLGGGNTIPGSTTSSTGGATGVTCPSTAFTCDQLFSCQEAIACLAAGNTSLDPDGDGLPCENICSP